MSLLRNVSQACNSLDISISGNLYRVSSPQQTPNPHQPIYRFILRSYGLLQCPSTSTIVRLTHSNIKYVLSKKLFHIVERDVLSNTGASCFSILLVAKDSNQYHAWKNAFQQVLHHVKYSFYHIDTTNYFSITPNWILFPAQRIQDKKSIAVKAISRKSPTHIISLVETHVAKFLKSYKSSTIPYPKSLVHIFDVFHTPNETHIVMESLHNNTLHNYLHRTKSTLSETIAKDLIAQLLPTLTFLHHCGIVHGCISPQNIYIISQQSQSPNYLTLKLAGFELSSIADNGDTNYYPSRNINEYKRFLQKQGTQYIPPEISHDSQVSATNDFWALGITLYKILVGRMPFTEDYYDCVEEMDSMDSYSNLTRSDLRQNILFPNDDQAITQLSPNAKSVLSQLLNPFPAQRMNAKSLIRHPWLAFAGYPVKEDKRNGAVSPVDVLVRENM